MVLKLHILVGGFGTVFETERGHELYEGRESGHGGTSDGQ